MATMTLGVSENAATRTGRSVGTSCCLAAARVVRTTSNSTPITPAKRLPNMKVIHLGHWLASIIESVHRGRSVGRTLSEYDAGH